MCDLLLEEFEFHTCGVCPIKEVALSPPEAGRKRSSVELRRTCSVR